MSAQVFSAELGLSRSMPPDTSRCGFGPSSAGTTRKDAAGMPPHTTGGVRPFLAGAGRAPTKMEG